MVCFEWRIERTPFSKSEGRKCSHTISSTPERRFSFNQSPASFSSLIYPVAKTRISIRRRQRKNQTTWVVFPALSGSEAHFQDSFDQFNRFIGCGRGQP